MSNTQLSSMLRRLLPLAGLLALIIFFSIKSPRGAGGENLFLSPENIFNIARQQSAILLIAFGMTLVIISGGIDLSVGSVAAFSGMVAALLMLPPDKGGPGLSVPVAMLFGTVAGAFCGSINAFLIAILRLPPFIATLGTMGIARGVTNIISKGGSVDVTAPGIGWLGDGEFLKLPVPLWIIVIVAVLCYLVLSKSVMGRQIYAVGGNPQAARFAGIDQRKTLFFVYVVTGALTGVAAMIDVSRSISAQPNAGQGAELDAIAAVVIGGASLFGGIGTIAGTIIGALVIAVLRNGANLMSVDPFLQQIIVGTLIIAAVAFDQWRQKKA
jgi:ribose transport system permease protein